MSEAVFDPLAAAVADRWLRTSRQTESTASLHVVCFPPAGGSSGSFAALRRSADPGVVCTSILLPGREARFTEEVPPDLHEVADQVARSLSALLGTEQTPYLLLGHSMGGLLAYETALRLVAAGAPQPLRVVVAGTSAPSHGARETLGSADPTSLMRRLQGVPQEVFDWPELLDIATATLRADLRMLQRYRCGGLRLDVPLTVLLGADDPVVGSPEAAAWSDFSSAETTFRTLPGGHFFLDPYYPDLLTEWRHEAQRCRRP